MFRPGTISTHCSTHRYSPALGLRTILPWLGPEHLPQFLKLPEESVHCLLLDLWPLRPPYSIYQLCLDQFPTSHDILPCLTWQHTCHLCFLWSSASSNTEYSQPFAFSSPVAGMLSPAEYSRNNWLSPLPVSLTQLSSNSYKVLGTSYSVPDTLLSIFFFYIHNNHEGRICISTLPVETECQ